MKSLLLLFIILCTFALIPARFIRTQSSLSSSNFKSQETKDNLKKMIDFLKKEIPGYGANKDKPEDVDGETDISKIDNDLTAENVKPMTTLQWVDAKTNFASKKEKDDYKIMLRFLHLRLKDTLMMIDQVFSDTTVFTRSVATTPSTFTGKFKEFNTPEVTVSIGDVKLNNKVEKNKKVKGNFVFGSSGSQSMKSDIDFQVRFSGTDPNNKPTIYECLLALYQFISAYNSKFLTIHGANSLIKYDINLYASDFGNKDLLTTVDNLKNNANEAQRWKKFVRANRYAQLHIVVNDARESFEHSAKVKVAFAKDVPDKMKLLIADGGVCVSYLFQSPEAAGSKQVLLSTQSRSFIKDDERNKIMVNHVEKAGRNMNSDTDPSDSMCHSLAANFYALEAYVSAGSVVEMLRVQGATRLDFYKLTEDDYVDSVLMNFAYGIQHYYEQLGIDPEGANDKIAKYLVRLYRSVNFLTNPKHKECWTTALKPLGLKAQDVDITTVEATIKAQKKTWAAGTLNGDTAKAIAVAGFGCVNEFGFEFEGSAQNTQTQNAQTQNTQTQNTQTQNTQSLSHSPSLTNLQDPKSLKNKANK